MIEMKGVYCGGRWLRHANGYLYLCKRMIKRAGHLDNESWFQMISTTKYALRC